MKMMVGLNTATRGHNQDWIEQSEDYAADEKTPNPYSSSFRMQTKFDRSPRYQRSRYDDNSDVSILKGAHIIKRQLSGSSVYDISRVDRKFHDGARIDDNNDEWCPWKTEKYVREKENCTNNGIDTDDDHETLKVLQKAKSIITSRSDNENMKNLLVQRVSEMDNSTFASSSYACGGVYDNPLSNNAGCKNEDISTSTLDFLANLHVEEEELKFMFDSFEEKQHALYAQSICYSSEQQSPPPIAAATMINQKIRIAGEEKYMTPCVTAASMPFQKMIAPRSSYYDEILRDPAYQHALKAGTLWQSLCSQHVHFPAFWWDRQEPACPPLGSTKKRPWAYLGRHRVQQDYKLNSLIGNRGSSGRILLHLVVRDDVSLETIEDISCGCFHPNARGIRTTLAFNPLLEDCRDVWIGHRRRARERRVYVQEEDSISVSDSDSDDEYALTTIEALLRHQNKNRIDTSPLGAQKSCVNNDNLRDVFGQKPPVYTVFVLESELYELFQTKLDGSIPASVVLLRHYLKYRI